MIVNIPRVHITEDEVVVSSKIEWESTKPSTPETVWFKFPAEYKKNLTKDSTVFVTSLLCPAMALGEDIIVKGEMSSQLAYNLREVQRIFNYWYPETFAPIKIECKKFSKENKKGKKVMLTFSGGLDSFHTLWSHLPKNESSEEHRITHALFMHGFDIPLEDKRTFSIASRLYRRLMNRLGIEFVTGSTNVKWFHDNLIHSKGDFDNWLMTAPPVIASVPQFFSNVFRSYFASGDTYRSIPSSLRDTAPLMSTERVEVIQHGTAMTRPEKIAALVEWKEPYKLLRVCWEKPNGILNCGKCQKCLLTMVLLQAFGTLDKYETFPKPLERKKIRGLRTKYFNNFGEVIKATSQLKCEKLTQDLEHALHMSKKEKNREV